jgi:hypothetical protein
LFIATLAGGQRAAFQHRTGNEYHVHEDASELHYPNAEKIVVIKTTDT